MNPKKGSGRAGSSSDSKCVPKKEAAAQPGSQEAQVAPELLTNGKSEQPNAECQTKKPAATPPNDGGVHVRFLVALGVLCVEHILGSLSLADIARSNTLHGLFLIDYTLTKKGGA